MTLFHRVVGSSDAGRRVDVVLAAWLDEPRGRAQSRLQAGEVTVDGATVAKSHRLHSGERVRVAEPTPTDVPVPGPVPVRYDDEDLLVVAKPAGLVVHAGAGRGQGTLVDALDAMGVPLGDPCGPHDSACPTGRPGIVHRLDRGTSGLLVIAKTGAAHRGLTALFKAHEVERVYTALVEGVPDPPQATIDAPIARSLTQRTRFAVKPDGRRAVSHYDVEEAYGRAALLTVRLETGRTHQVRVHLSAVGHPVCGDRVYGAAASLTSELGLERPALHAGRLGFRHPVSGRWIAVDEPPPPDFLRARGALRAGAESEPVPETG